MPKVLTAFSGDAPVYKRRVGLVMRAGAAADTGPDTSNVYVLPYGTAGAATTWKLMSALLDVETPNANATTVQLFSSSGGNAAFGAGTALLPSPLSVNGTSTYQSSTNTFVSASQSLASGTKLARQFSALGGNGAALFTEWEEV